MVSLKALVIAGLAGIAATQSGYAQTDARAPRPGTPAVAPNAPAVIGAAPRAAFRTAPNTPFRPFSASREDLTLRGEFATAERAVFLSPNDALRANAFRIGFNNAVSNLPDVSRLAVRINDQLVGDVSLTAGAVMGEATFAVPPGVLVPGYNSVRFSASQRHRVDCSINATYELWTEIVPAQTGFMNISPVPQIRRAMDLPMLAGIAAGRTPIRIRLPHDAGGAIYDQAQRVANALILVGGIMQPSIEVAPEPGIGPGIDLIIGSGVSAAAGQRLEPDMGLYVAQDANSERVVLSIPSSETEANGIIQRLERMAAQNLRPGSRAGQRAMANMVGRRVGSGSSLSFAELGMESRAFDGHLLQASTRIVLPPDFFPAPYGSARLQLSSAYAGDDTPGRRITISVNDQIASTVPIAKPGQGGRDDRSIELPLQIFKPGLNVITVEANLSDTAAACDATVSHSSGARFVIGPASKITFDQLARVASYPNLSATLGHGFPYSDGRAPMVVGVSARDPAFLDGAMTVIGRMVASAQMPIPTAFRFGPLSPGADTGMFFGSPSEAPYQPEELGRPGVTPPAAPVVGSAAPRTRLASAAGEAGYQNDASWLAANANQSEQPPALDGFGGDKLDFGGTLSSLKRLAGGDLSDLTAWLQDFGLVEKPRDASAAEAFDESGVALIIRQTVQRDPGASNLRGFFDSNARPIVQTAILAADPSKFAELIEKATGDSIWSRFAGDSARVRLEDWGPHNRFSQQRIYAASGDMSPGNMRLVAAGWLSLNQGYYLMILTWLVVLLAVTTSIALKSRRT